MGLLTLCFSTKTSTKTRHASSFITVAAIKAWVPNSGLIDWAASMPIIAKRVSMPTKANMNQNCGINKLLSPKYIKYKGPAANNKLNMKNGNILRAIFNF